MLVQRGFRGNFTLWFRPHVGARLLLLLVLLGPSAAAEAATRLDAGTNTDGGTGDPRVQAFRDHVAAIRSFLEEKLDVATDPQSLFDVAIGGDAVVDLEAKRLTALLDEIDAANVAAEKSVTRAPRPQQGSPSDAVRDAGPGADAGMREVDANLWRARLELDRSRLAFYALPLAQRQALIASHARRQQEAAPPLTAAEIRAKEADAERQRALRAAQEARSDGQRLVSEEHIRLLGIERAQADFDKELAGKRQAIVARQEATLGWQRRAREAREKKATSDEFDASYDALRKDLRSARDALDRALDELADVPNQVPLASEDPLGDVPAAMDASAAREARARVVAESSRLEAELERVRTAAAAQLLAEVG